MSVAQILADDVLRLARIRSKFYGTTDGAITHGHADGQAIITLDARQLSAPADFATFTRQFADIATRLGHPEAALFTFPDGQQQQIADAIQSHRPAAQPSDATPLVPEFATYDALRAKNATLTLRLPDTQDTVLQLRKLTRDHVRDHSADILREAVNRITSITNQLGEKEGAALRAELLNPDGLTPQAPTR